MKKVRTRFAPSPTGYMHIGNLRTALYEYLIAKHEDGDFILRIEDTDQEREVEGAVEMIYDVMKKTGLDYDEGPDKPGNYGPYVQSQRLGMYKEYAEQLVELGGAHYCFCSEDEIAKQKEAAQGEAFLFVDPCHNISLEEAKQRVAAKEPYVIRQTIKRHGITTFDDEVYGRIEVENKILDESILLKSDGFPTYNFANIIDDHQMEITHVVRGNEYLSSTPKYNLIYNAFGWDVPTYVHVPPVMKDEHHKLSKRNGDASYQDLIKQGYLNDAIINYIALLGWAPEGEEEIFSLDDLKRVFDVKRISRSGAIFDIEKLKWMNGIYIRNLSLDAFHEMVTPYYEKDITREVDLKELSKVLQLRIATLAEIDEAIDFINEPHAFDPELFNNKKMKTNPENSLEALIWVKEALEGLDNFDDFDKLHDTFMDLAQAKEVKNGRVMWPVRVALTFKAFTPGGAIELAKVFGKEETLRRIEMAIAHLQNN